MFQLSAKSNKFNDYPCSGPTFKSGNKCYCYRKTGFFDQNMAHIIWAVWIVHGSLKGTTESDKRTMHTIYVTSPDGYQIVIDKSDWIRFSDSEKPLRRQAITISDIVVRPIWNSEESLRHRKFMGYEIRFETGTKIFIKLRVQGSIFRETGHI